MTKKEIEDIIRRLKEYENRFNLTYPDYKNGKNKGVRDKAERDLESLMHQVENYIYENDVFGIAGENGDGQGQIFREDEFFQRHHFSMDVAQLIRKLEEIMGNGNFD
jgi:hypothetical protein